MRGGEEKVIMGHKIIRMPAQKNEASSEIKEKLK